MTAVVLLGDVPATNLINGAVADRITVDSALSPDSAGMAIARISAGLQARRAVLVLYPAWQAAVARRLLPMVRAGLGTDRVGGLALDLPPLAMSLVADQLAFIAPHVRPGVLASVAPRLARAVLAGAWVNSVAKLEQVSIGLGDHVASYLPGKSGFMVSASPEPGVHRISGSDPVGQLDYRPPAPLMVVTAQENGDLDWLRNKFMPAIQGSQLLTVDPQPLSTKFWGTKKYLEYVVFSGHVQALEHSLRSTVCRPCTWCSEPTALPTCPFCGMAQLLPDPPEEVVPPTRPDQPAPHPAAQPGPVPVPGPGQPVPPPAGQPGPVPPPAPPPTPAQQPAPAPLPAPVHDPGPVHHPKPQPGREWPDTSTRPDRFPDRPVPPADRPPARRPAEQPPHQPPNWYGDQPYSGMTATDAARRQPPDVFDPVPN